MCHVLLLCPVLCKPGLYEAGRNTWHADEAGGQCASVSAALVLPVTFLASPCSGNEPTALA